MTTNGKARAQQWLAWFGGMALSALTATSTISFIFGGALNDLERVVQQVPKIEKRVESVSDSLAKYSLSSAETYQTKRDAREQELRLERWLTRVESKLDTAIENAGR